VKRWFRIDHNTKAVTASSVNRVQVACEVQLGLTRQGARDLIAAASALNNPAVIVGTARFELREVSE
jgi:hypothetical protein